MSYDSDSEKFGLVSAYQTEHNDFDEENGIPEVLTPEELQKVNFYQKLSKGFLSMGLCILVGFILGLIGVFSVQFGFQAAIDETVFDSKILVRGSRAYHSWLKSGDIEKHVSSSRVFASVVMLNLTNPVEVLAGGIPKYEELPPVVYERKFKKFDVSQSGDNSTISFKETVIYTPDFEKSKLDPMLTQVTNINPSYLTVMYRDGGERKLWSRMISSTIQDIFRRMTTEYVSKAFHGSRGPILNGRMIDIELSLDDFCVHWIEGAPTDDKWKDMTLRLFESDATANITISTCRDLWTKTNEYALNEDAQQSLIHSDIWISAMNGDKIAADEIISRFEGLTVEGLDRIIVWLKQFDRRVTWDWIKQKVFEVRKPITQGDLFVYEDLGYFQWGQGSGNPFSADESIQEILNLPATPELYYWAKNIYLNIQFDIPTCKRLTKLFSEQNTIAFLKNYEEKKFEAIMKDWFLTQEQIEALAKYMKFVGDSFFVARLRNFGESNKGLLSTKSIHEWLIEYDDKFLELVERKNFADQLTILKNVPHDDKNSIISTGVLDLSKASHYILYEGTTTLPWVGDNGENVTVIGSDGTQFHSNIQDGDYLRLWSPETMRTRELIYDSSVKREGVDVYKFKEAAYMWRKNSTFQDFYTGQSNMTMFGTPLFIGNWRFYGSDDVWRTRVNGLKPAVEGECITMFEVEPFTGLTFDRKKRYQVNMHIPEDSNWLDLFHPQFSNNATLYPIAMVEEATSITSENAKDFKNELPNTVLLRDILYWIMAAICLVCFVIGGIITLTAFALKNRALGKVK